MQSTKSEDMTAMVMQDTNGDYELELDHNLNDSSSSAAAAHRNQHYVSGVEQIERIEEGYVQKETQKRFNDPSEAFSTPSQDGHSLEWTNISMTTIPPKAKVDGRRILENVWGRCPSGKVTAVMGPSGSGKTSLLNVLSGRMTSKRTKSVTIDTKNNILWNNYLVDPASIYFRKTIAFVAQDDSLLDTATPREAIAFSAKLRLPKTTTETQIKAIVTGMLHELNLLDCADTMVGGALVKGLSGGERKRTSVGVELVTRPRIIFMDEPTSGLDSFNALELIQVLRKVAKTGSSVLLTIHQPSSQIFSAIDRLILLKAGRVMYGGLVKNVPRYFAKRGHPIPEHHNPADEIIFIAQTQSVETLERQGFFHRPPENPNAPTTGLEDNDDARRSIKSAAMINKPGFFVQVKLLFQRELRHLVRNKKGLQARTGMTLVVSLLGGAIYWQVADSDFSNFINVQSTFGGLLLSLLANVFSVALPSLISFATERPVFVREYSTNHYQTSSYFLARFVTEFLVTAGQVILSSMLTYTMMGLNARFGVIWASQYLLALTSTALAVLVGATASEPSLAIEFVPLIFMPQILFAGFFVPPTLIPVWLRWLTYVFPLAYATKIVLVAEFDGACDGFETTQSNPDGSTTSINYCDRILLNTQAYPEDRAMLNFNPPASHGPNNSFHKQLQSNNTSTISTFQINKSRRYVRKSGLCPVCQIAETGDKRVPTCENAVRRYLAKNNATELEALNEISSKYKPCQLACSIPCSDSDRSTRIFWRLDDIAPPIIHGRTYYLQSVPDKHRIPKAALADLDSYFARKENVYPQRSYFFEYNPSIVKIPDGCQLPVSLAEKPVYLASFRLATTQQCVTGSTEMTMFGGSYPYPADDNALGIALLRADLSVISDVAVNMKAIDSYVQDYRVFAFDNQLYLSSHYFMRPFWLVPPTGPARSGTVKLKHKFDDNGQHSFDFYIREAPSCTRYKEGKRNGKNLNFFMDQKTNETMMELLPMGPKIRIDLSEPCNYTAEPQEPHILPPADSALEATFRTMEERFYGDAVLFMSDRGSACCVSFPDPRDKAGPPLLLGISHTKTLRGPVEGFGSQYASRFYAMESVSPYKVVAFTGRFCFGFPNEQEQDNPYARLNLRSLFMGEPNDCPRIHFVSGMLETDDDPSQLVIAYGVNDCAPRIVQVQKEYVIRLLFPTSDMELK
ncbi:hypothetical protein MPSEU_000228900 [Mayamaea pseudoterrestris]|nr:hypothetical protein MPSEU_000228900 [Mayamaea pseudoterrestris]